MNDVFSLYDAKTHLSRLVERAADGEEIVITKNGVARARLVKMPLQGKKREPAGALQITSISEEFNDPLPADIQAAFDGQG